MMLSKSSPLDFKSLKVRHLAIIFILANIASGVLFSIIKLDPKSTIFTCSLYMSAMLLSCFWIFQRCRQLKIEVKEIIGDFPSPLQWRKIFNIVFSILFFSTGSGLIMFWMLSHLSPSFLQSLVQPKSLSISQSMPALERTIVFVMMVIVAPITEEFLFRGIILNRWIKKWGLIQGLIASSLLFGFLHINPIGLSMFGLVIGLLYLQTKEIWTPILCHALNNLIAFSLMFFSQSNNPKTSIESFKSMGWIGVIITLIALSFLVPFLKENFHKVRIKFHPPAA